MPDSKSTPPCPPLILEGELDTTAGADKRSDISACGRHARYLTPPLRLEGGRGALKISGIYHRIEKYFVWGMPLF